MEQQKHLDPFISASFKDLSNLLLQNYKDNSSMNSSQFGSTPAPGVTNTLAKLNQSDIENLSSDSELTVSSLRKHNVNLAKAKYMGANSEDIQEVPEDAEEGLNNLLDMEAK